MANPRPNLKNLKPFKKGVDTRRNLKGQPPKLPEITQLLDKVLGEKRGDITAMEAIMLSLLNKATKGDVRAAEVLLNRAYGMSKQTIDVKGEITSFEVGFKKPENNTNE